MNSWALAITCFAAVATLLVPRKHALCPLIIGSVCLPPYNALLIGEINLPVLRILLLCLLLRGLIRNERTLAPPSDLDNYILIWAIWMTVSYLTLTFSLGAVINRIGTVWVDLVLTYFLCRNYLADLTSVLRTGKLLILLSVILGVSAFLEYFAKYNVFATIGGMPFVQIRGATLRCQGPFAHPITFGSFAALSVPLIWAALKAGLIRRLEFCTLPDCKRKCSRFFGLIIARLYSCGCPSFCSRLEVPRFNASNSLGDFRADLRSGTPYERTCLVVDDEAQCNGRVGLPSRKTHR